MSNRAEGEQMRASFRAYKYRRPDRQTQFDQAQLSMIDISMTLLNSGLSLLAVNRVLRGIENAKSPNAVSRALRGNLSPTLIRSV